MNIPIWRIIESEFPVVNEIAEKIREQEAILNTKKGVITAMRGLAKASASTHYSNKNLHAHIRDAGKHLYNEVVIPLNKNNNS